MKYLLALILGTTFLTGCSESGLDTQYYRNHPEARKEVIELRGKRLSEQRKISEEELRIETENFINAKIASWEDYLCANGAKNCTQDAAALWILRSNYL